MVPRGSSRTSLSFLYRGDRAHWRHAASSSPRHAAVPTRGRRAPVAKTLTTRSPAPPRPFPPLFLPHLLPLVLPRELLHCRRLLSPSPLFRSSPRRSKRTESPVVSSSPSPSAESSRGRSTRRQHPRLLPHRCAPPSWFRRRPTLSGHPDQARVPG